MDTPTLHRLPAELLAELVHWVPDNECALQGPVSLIFESCTKPKAMIGMIKHAIKVLEHTFDAVQMGNYLLIMVDKTRTEVFTQQTALKDFWLSLLCKGGGCIADKIDFVLHIGVEDFLMQEDSDEDEESEGSVDLQDYTSPTELYPRTLFKTVLEVV